MKIIGVCGANTFGKAGKEVFVRFHFEDKRDELNDQTGLALVWIGGESNGNVNYAFKDKIQTNEIFSQEEKNELYEYAKNIS